MLLIENLYNLWFNSRFLSLRALNNDLPLEVFRAVSVAGPYRDDKINDSTQYTVLLSGTALA
jgi:hypothetical protein